VSNLCRGKPSPPLSLTAAALPFLARVLYSVDDEVITDALWALSYLSDGENNRIQAVIEAGIVRRTVELLMHSNHSVKTPGI
jgi:importin subunit alpha-1